MLNVGGHVNKCDQLVTRGGGDEVLHLAQAGGESNPHCIPPDHQAHSIVFFYSEIVGGSPATFSTAA